MNLTKEEIQALPENKLRQSVLIPLFREMGFRDVFEYHGGPQEQGKDIVMWKAEELRERTNFAVVVKATKITGQASGKSSAAEVCFQIQQAFGSAYKDSQTGEEQTVHECIVVSSKEISKEAIESIQSFLSPTNLHRRVVFQNGDRLWDLVQKHFPAAAALNKVREIQRHLDAIDPNYRLIPRFSIEPKPSAPGSSPPPSPKVSLKFPDTSEGKSKFHELQNHIKTGAPVTIPNPFIAKVQFPNVFKALFSENKKYSLEFPARTDDKNHLVKFQANADDGSAAELSFIELRTIQVGTDEITLNNFHQQLPWKITLVMNRALVTASCRFNMIFDANVHQVLDAFKFHQVMSKSATATVIDLGTGLELMRFRTGSPENPAPQPIDALIVELAEKMDFIQSKAQVLITWPVGKISAEMVQHVFVTAEILRTGKIVQEIEGVTFTGSRTTAQRILDMGEHAGMMKTASQGDEIVDVGGQSITLGPVMALYRDVFVTPQDQTELRQQLEDQAREDFQLVFTGKEGSVCERFYPKWLPQAEAEVIRQHMKPPEPNS